ncbi:RHS repeat-associated core domain-containing protein [Pseudoalteromonas sp. A757]|uniref:RHS repeat domain-containing protein n=1 Tax=Pseudoalteromonas sp. A757 TaxID=2250709 RepID=UPI001F01A6EA|nr:RHS repeat-associated core domain-containing protein [Pseudoalteromonas sp. A757]
MAYRNFDVFGKPRGGDGQVISPAKLSGNVLDLELFSSRGFTDHEHLDELALIHMNGRVYDYNLGRFMSVDPMIQSPGDSQSINPYSYLMNNPLAGTDPTGYCAAATGTHIKSCGDMKVEVKVDGKTVGSTVVKDVNFRNGAEVSGAMAKGAGQIGQAISDLGSQQNIAKNQAPASSGLEKHAFDGQQLGAVINPEDPNYRSKVDGMDSLFKDSEVGPGSDFNSESEIVNLLDTVVHPYAEKIKMEIGTNIYTKDNGKLTFAPLVLADIKTPLKVDTERSTMNIRIAPSRVTADWHSHARAANEMSGPDRDLAILLNRTSYVSSKYGIATFRGSEYNAARRLNSDAYQYMYRGRMRTEYMERSPAVDPNDFYSLHER